MTNTPDKIASEIAAEMSPAPAPIPPAAAPATPAAPAPQPPVDRDSIGREFSHEKFAVNGDGSPKIDKNGRFIPRGLGRPAKAKTPPPQASYIPTARPAPAAADSAAPGDAATPAAPATAADAPDRFQLLADVYARAAIAGAMGVLGEDWAPDDDAEFIALRNAAAAYLRATNREDLSPGWALAFAGLTYAGKRLPRQKTQTRLAFFRERIAAWWRGNRVARVVNAMPSPGGN